MAHRLTRESFCAFARGAADTGVGREVTSSRASIRFGDDTAASRRVKYGVASTIRGRDGTHRRGVFAHGCTAAYPAPGHGCIVARRRRRRVACRRGRRVVGTLHATRRCFINFKERCACFHAFSVTGTRNSGRLAPTNLFQRRIHDLEPRLRIHRTHSRCLAHRRRVHILSAN